MDFNEFKITKSKIDYDNGIEKYFNTLEEIIKVKAKGKKTNKLDIELARISEFNKKTDSIVNDDPLITDESVLIEQESSIEKNIIDEIDKIIKIAENLKIKLSAISVILKNDYNKQF